MTVNEKYLLLKLFHSPDIHSSICYSIRTHTSQCSILCIEFIHAILLGPQLGSSQKIKGPEFCQTSPLICLISVDSYALNCGAFQQYSEFFELTILLKRSTIEYLIAISGYRPVYSWSITTNYL